MSFCEYYNTVHSIRIKEVKQPLLVCTRNGKKAHIIPELVYFYNCVSPLHPKTKELSQKVKEVLNVTPQQAEDYLSPVISELSSLKLIKKSAEIFDFAPLPQVNMQTSNGEVPVIEGAFSFRGGIMKSVELKNWGIAYTNTGIGEKNEAVKVFFNLKTISSHYGIKLSTEPGYIEVESGGIDSWQKRLKEDVHRYGPPLVLFVLLKNN